MTTINTIINKAAGKVADIITLAASMIADAINNGLGEAISKLEVEHPELAMSSWDDIYQTLLEATTIDGFIYPHENLPQGICIQQYDNMRQFNFCTCDEYHNNQNAEAVLIFDIDKHIVKSYERHEQDPVGVVNYSNGTTISMDDEVPMPIRLIMIMFKQEAAEELIKILTED